MKLKADLSISSIRKLQKELKKYRDGIEYKARLLTEKLAEEGVEIAKTNVDSLDAIFTGDLINSIYSKEGSSQKGTAIFYIVADSRHAAFVEFGTGQLGQEGSYPYPLPEGVEWNYNTGKTIFEIEPGKYGWFYPGNDGKWYFTQGMPSRPFFMETSIELMSIVAKTAKEIFK